MGDFVHIVGDREAGALFDSIDGALRFAFGAADRGPAGTLGRLQKISGGPRLFDNREERLAVIGSIRRRIGTLAPLHQAMLVLRYAPSSFPCSCRSPCCSGRRRNDEWADAFGLIVTTASTACEVNRRALAEGAVRRWCGDKTDIGRLADRCGVHRNTAGKHAKAAAKWLDATERAAIDQVALCL